MTFSAAAEGNLRDRYISEEWLYERYAGDRLWSWGYNFLPQEFVPVSNCKEVTTGRDFTSIIKTDGTLWSYGTNTSGQLGDGTVISRDVFVQTISGGTNWKTLEGNNNNIAAIKTDGTLWTWGENDMGTQLGISTPIRVSSPVQTVAGGNNWKQVSTGLEGHSGAIKTDGTLWMWGYNTEGQTGRTDRTNEHSPAQTIAGGNNWKQVSCGYQFTAAVKTDGTLWCWGWNTNGALGINNDGGFGIPGTIRRVSSAVQTIAGGNNWKQVATGGSWGSVFTAAIKTDGTLWTWGHNTFGQLGDGTTAHRSSPVQTVAGGTNWKQVSVSKLRNYSSGWLMTAAIKTDGTLWTWGDNYQKILGDGTTTPRSSPVQTIAGGNNWKRVSCGAGWVDAITINNENTIGAF